jgi:DNA-directed RNA polymerase subunit E'/Rpb7
MEAVKQIKKRQDKLQTIYSRCLLTRKIVLPITCIGKNLDIVIKDYIINNFEGKCVVEGFIKPQSSKIVHYSSGVIERGNNIVFEVVFECETCFPVEGMKIKCVAKEITKAGIRAESADDVPSPIVVFVARDHHFNTQHFNEVKDGDIITIRVIGQRFELNDKYVSIIGELVKEKDVIPKQKQPAKPRLVIEEN